ncbi:hypothetical protein FA15DRAFT_666694 [Coprinopsis marcescibilis]|uniref:SH3 domain-containing protein n=1 Tax=Coprinopsis marcescibilis TaxID=230819 RepID=A0A5C3L3J7_COPMA|nr:hypothetical protein FA15DRAFT_666694 [Coprinopsis marcescibilis]
MPGVYATQLERRIDVKVDTDGEPSLNNISIAGIAVVGGLLVFIGAWLIVYWYRKRARENRQSNLGAAFLSVRGIVRVENGIVYQEKSLDYSTSQGELQARYNGFSGSQMQEAIAFPDPVVMPALGAGSRDRLHRQSSTFPKPFSFALGRGSPNPQVESGGASTICQTPLDPPATSETTGSRSSWIRHSFFSTHSTGHADCNRYSVISSAPSSCGSEHPTAGTARKVQQLFSPVLPDELMLTKVGEQLTLIQSFDDGWCVVGRDNASGLQQRRSFFGNRPSTPGVNVEIGIVPAWCFLQPVLGLRAERPLRSTSLGITVQVDEPSAASRNDLISWSNF